MSRLLKIGFDCDGVLFDFHSHACGILVKEGYMERVSDLVCHDIHLQYPETEQRVTEIVALPSVYRSLPVIKQGFDLAASLLQKGHYVEFLTARGDHLRDLTYQRVSEILHEYELYISAESVLTFGSSTAKAAYMVEKEFDCLIEDNPSTHEKLMKAGVSPEHLYLVKQFWNRGYEGVLPRLDFSEIRDRILGKGEQWRDTSALNLNQVYQATRTTVRK